MFIYLREVDVDVQENRGSRSVAWAESDSERYYLQQVTKQGAWIGLDRPPWFFNTGWISKRTASRAFRAQRPVATPIPSLSCSMHYISLYTTPVMVRSIVSGGRVSCQCLLVKRK